MIRPLLASLLLAAPAALAQTYDPPNPRNSVSARVVRTDAGGITHLKVLFTVPPSHSSIPAYGQAFFYGWIEADGKRLAVSASKGADAPFGFPAQRRTYTPGEQVTLEIDLPKAFVEAAGAHLHAGIGAIGGSYFPTANLLVQK